MLRNNVLNFLFFILIAVKKLFLKFLANQKLQAGVDEPIRTRSYLLSQNLAELDLDV